MHTDENSPSRSPPRSMQRSDSHSALKTRWKNSVAKILHLDDDENNDSNKQRPSEFLNRSTRHSTLMYNNIHNSRTDDDDNISEDRHPAHPSIHLSNVVDALTEFDPRPLRSLFSSKQKYLQILVINDKKYLRHKKCSTDIKNFVLPRFSEIKSLSMNDLLDDLVSYANSQLYVHTSTAPKSPAITKSNQSIPSQKASVNSNIPNKLSAFTNNVINNVKEFSTNDSNINSSIEKGKATSSRSIAQSADFLSPLSQPAALNSSQQKNHFSPGSSFNIHQEAFEKIQELRGRDLCVVVRHINEVDIPVVMIRQHAVIFSIRYDVKAVVQAHRIIFIGENANDDFRGLRRHMNVFLDDDTTGSETGTEPPSVPGMKLSNPINDSSNLQMLDHFPFEVRAVEGLLSTVIGIHNNEYDNLSILAEPYFTALLPGSSSSNSSGPQGSLLNLEQQEDLRRIKENMSDILSRIKFTTQMIQKLLDEEELLPFLCLNAFAKDSNLYQKYNHATCKSEAQYILRSVIRASEINDIEFLLEYHLTESQQLEYEVNGTLKRLENAEQSIMVRLNMSQNQLLIANTIVTVLAAAVAFGSFIAGLFGMNLDNDKYQEYGGSFVGVTLLTISAVALIAVFTIYFFQQTSMLPSEIVLDVSNQSYRRNTLTREPSFRMSSERELSSHLRRSHSINSQDSFSYQNGNYKRINSDEFL